MHFATFNSQRSELMSCSTSELGRKLAVLALYDNLNFSLDVLLVIVELKTKTVFRCEGI